MLTRAFLVTLVLLLGAVAAQAQERAIYRLDLTAAIDADASGVTGTTVPDGYLVIDHDGAGNVTLQTGSWVFGDLDLTFGSGETTNDEFALAISGATGTLTGTFASGTITWSTNANVNQVFGTRTCTQASNGLRCSTDTDIGASGAGTFAIVSPGVTNPTLSGPPGGAPLPASFALGTMTLSGTSMSAPLTAFADLGTGVTTDLTIDATRVDTPAAEKVIIDLNPAASSESIAGTPVVATTPVDGFVTLEISGSSVTVLGSSWFYSINNLDWSPTPIGPGNRNGRLGFFQLDGGAGTLTGTSTSGSIAWDIFLPSTVALEVSGKTCTQPTDQGICTSDPDFFLVLGNPTPAGPSVVRADMIDILDFALGDMTLSGTSVSSTSFGFNDDGIPGNGVFTAQIAGSTIPIPEPGMLAGLVAGIGLLSRIARGSRANRAA